MVSRSYKLQDRVFGENKVFTKLHATFKLTSLKHEHVQEIYGSPKARL